MSTQPTVIHAYTTAQAIEDGVLIDLRTRHPKEVAESGIQWRVLMTSAAYATAIAMTPMAERMCNDLTGRAWDVMWMLRLALLRIKRRGESPAKFYFKVLVVRDRPEPTLTTLKVVIDGDGTGQPAFYIMLPHED